MKKVIITASTLLFMFVFFFALQTNIVTKGDSSLIVTNAKALATIKPKFAALSFANCYQAYGDICVWTPYIGGPCNQELDYSEAGIAVDCVQ